MTKSKLEQIISVLNDITTIYKQNYSMGNWKDQKANYIGLSNMLLELSQELTEQDFKDEYHD